MFLLIGYCTCQASIFIDFNTSHVSINLCNTYYHHIFTNDFNTSHVSINLLLVLLFARAAEISIHLMFLLIRLPVRDCCGDGCISIHLMFLLICYPTSERMWRIYFNTSHVSINLIQRRRQLREMQYFNTSHVSINLEKKKHGKILL